MSCTRSHANQHRGAEHCQSQPNKAKWARLSQQVVLHKTTQTALGISVPWCSNPSQRMEFQLWRKIKNLQVTGRPMTWNGEMGGSARHRPKWGSGDKDSINPLGNLSLLIFKKKKKGTRNGHPNGAEIWMTVSFPASV